MTHRETDTPLAQDRFVDLRPAALNPAEKTSVVQLALKVLAERHRRGRHLSNPTTTKEYLRLKLVDYQNEVFGATRPPVPFAQ